MKRLFSITLSALLLYFSFIPVVFAVNLKAKYFYNAGIVQYNYNNIEGAIDNFKKAVEIDPLYKEALAELAFAYKDIKNYPQAEKYFEKVLEIDPDYDDIKYRLADLHYELGQNCIIQKDYQNAIKYLEKAVIVTPDDSLCHFQLGYSYLKTQNYEKAVYHNKKVLELDPQNELARNNLNVAYEKLNQSNKQKALNNFKVKKNSAKTVYDLVKINPNIDQASRQIVYEVLDVLSEDPEGKLLLDIILKNKVTINITPGKSYTNAKLDKQKHYIMIYGFIPIFWWTTRTKVVNIGESYLYNYKNKNLSVDERIHGFQALTHEFFHVVNFLHQKNYRNAMEEEITGSLIGYNIAHRIFLGREMTVEEIKEYSQNLLKGLLSDEHRDLPLNNGFVFTMQELGFNPPHPEIYRDLTKVYKYIKNDPQTVKEPRLEPMHSQ